MKGKEGMVMCKECYVDTSRATPLLHPEECLKHHTQYICGTCGRVICIEKDEKRGLQRWNFPFQSFEKAMLYLRTADVTLQTNCGIYELENEKGRKMYKIFGKKQDLLQYLKQHKNKRCVQEKPLFRSDTYEAYPNTEIRKLSETEIQTYQEERKQALQKKRRKSHVIFISRKKA